MSIDRIPPKPFREFYTERHGVWPGSPGERRDVIFRRICDAQADYIDEIVAPAAIQAMHPPMMCAPGLLGGPVDTRPGRITRYNLDGSYEGEV
jgi:hypothetical protein